MAVLAAAQAVSFFNLVNEEWNTFKVIRSLMRSSQGLCLASYLKFIRLISSLCVLVYIGVSVTLFMRKLFLFLLRKQFLGNC